MSDSRQQWTKLFTGWGEKEPGRKFKCPYCFKRFLNEQGLLGHWAGVHKKHGKPRPNFDPDAELERVKPDPKKQLRSAQAKGRASGTRKHRTIQECEEVIEQYEEALLTMTAKEYEQQSGVSKQQVSQVRTRLKKLRQSQK